MRRDVAIAVGCAAGLASAAAVHPLAPAALVSATSASAWLLASPFRTLGAFVAVIFLRPQEIMPDIAFLPLAKITLGCAVIVFVLQRLVSREWKWPSSRLNPWMAGLAVAVLASSVLSTQRSESLELFQRDFIKTIILYVLVLYLVDSPRRVGTMLLIIGANCAALGAYALHAKMTGQATIEGSRAGFVGMLGNPNDLALSLLAGVPFLVTASLEFRGSARAGLSLLALVAIGGVLATQSRGGLLGLSVALWIVLRSRVRRKVVQVAAVALVVTAMIAMSGVLSRSSGGLTEYEAKRLDDSAQSRLEAWGAGLRMVGKHPLLGVGFGAFAANYRDYVSRPVQRLDSHNSFVKVAAETGTLGLVPFVMLVGLALHGAVRIRSSRDLLRRGLERAAADALLPTLAGFFLAAFFLSQSWSWFTFLLLALAAAMERCVAAQRLEASKHNPETHRAPAPAAC